MIDRLQRMGHHGLGFSESLGRSGVFLTRTLLRAPKIRKVFPLLIEELYSVGVLSMSIILVSALFIGMVVGLQGYNTLEKFAATTELGQVLALSITRELGPVITALLFAGRAGSALTAEIGLMKATEQLASMEKMGVDTLWRIIYPRFWAGFIAMPILGMIFSAVAIFGGYLIGVEWLGVDAGSFWSNMQSAVDFRIEVESGIIKSIVFGFIVAWIALFQGYDATPTSAGISRATTRTVVYSSLAVLGLDFVLTAIMIGGW